MPLTDVERDELRRVALDDTYAEFGAQTVLALLDALEAAEERIFNLQGEQLAGIRYMQEAQRLREVIAGLADLCDKVIDVHAQVQMDTAEDRALHARAVGIFRDYHGALLSTSSVRGEGNG